MRTLVGIPFSPWTEKARWALDHHGIAYRFESHLPVVNEVLIRARRRRLRGRVSVPLLLAGDEVCDDSFAIARYAERHGRGEPLFFDAAGVEAYEARSEAALRAGRALFLERLKLDDGARADSMPSFVPPVLRGPLDGVARMTIDMLTSKYETTKQSTFDHETTLRQNLDDLRAALGGRAHLLGDRLSYADITMTAPLHFIAPLSDAYVPVTSAIRRALTHTELARSYQDLVDWREALYARSRAKSAQQAA
jgi:glutathione S-transferase